MGGLLQQCVCVFDEDDLGRGDVHWCALVCIGVCVLVCIGYPFVILVQLYTQVPSRRYTHNPPPMHAPVPMVTARSVDLL